MKTCPFCCKQDLDDNATKCPHCATWLDGRLPDQPDFNALRRELHQELRDGRQDYQDYLSSIFNRVQFAASIILALVIGASAWFGFRTDSSITEIKDEIKSRIESEFHSQKMREFMTERISDEIESDRMQGLMTSRIGGVIDDEVPVLRKQVDEMTEVISTQAEQSSENLRNLAAQAAKTMERDAAQAREKLTQAKEVIDAIERDIAPTRERLEEVERTASKTRAAIVNAAGAPVRKVTLPVRPISMEPKKGIGEIPRLVRERPDALHFKLGYGGYFGPAIWLYLDALGRVPEFRYVVLTEGNSLFGVYDAKTLIAELNPPKNAELSLSFPFGSSDMPESENVPEWTRFAESLNQGGNESRLWLTSLPGFVSADMAVPQDTDKRMALQQMEAERLHWLPVVDNRKTMVGIVDRSNLTSSLLLEIAMGVQQVQ
jgi:hypothetical protein